MSTVRPIVVAAMLSMVALVMATTTGAASPAVRPAVDTSAAPTVASAAAAARPSGVVPEMVSFAGASPATAVTQAASAAVSASRPPCAITARACVDLSAGRAWLTNGDGLITYGPVGVLGGRRGEPTPIGTFHVINKVRNYHSREFDAPMPNSVFFAAGIAFHSGSLSTQSAGCLHLSPASSRRFFAELNRGDEVQIVP